MAQPFCLMANLHNLEEGINEVELLNFYTNQNITIKLKKELSPQKNAENYYRHCISLPMYPTLTNEEQNFVIEKIDL